MLGFKLIWFPPIIEITLYLVLRWRLPGFRHFKLYLARRVNAKCKALNFTLTKFQRLTAARSRGRIELDQPKLSSMVDT